MAKPSFAKPASEPFQSPYLGASVVVKTSEKIGGQNEHAAMITQVHSDGCVNVMVFPGVGEPYPISSIDRESGLPCWRWPARN